MPFGVLSCVTAVPAVSFLVLGCSRLATYPCPMRLLGYVTDTSLRPFGLVMVVAMCQRTSACPSPAYSSAGLVGRPSWPYSLPWRRLSGSFRQPSIARFPPLFLVSCKRALAIASGGVPGCYSVSELCALTGGGRLPGHLPVACCPTCVVGGPGLHTLRFLFGLSLAFSPGGGPGSGCRPSIAWSGSLSTLRALASEAFFSTLLTRQRLSGPSCRPPGWASWLRSSRLRLYPRVDFLAFSPSPGGGLPACRMSSTALP